MSGTARGLATRLDEEQLARLAALLHRCAGLVFDVPRHPVLDAAVVERLAETGRDDVAGYLRLLEDERRGADERAALLDRVTVPETCFFRTAPHVAALRTVLLPRLLAAAAAEGRGLQVWSAGCSTGEEAYTLALLLRDLAPVAGVPLERVRVLGTDVSRRALAAAERAVYRARSVQLVPADVLASSFTAKGDGATPVPAVRELVRFAAHNLVRDPPPLAPGSVDLVVCRNVTIYFDRETTRRVLERAATVLRPEGRLLLGPAETLWHSGSVLLPERLGDVHVYRLPGPSDVPPAGTAGAPTSGSAASPAGAPRRRARAVLRPRRRAAPPPAPAVGPVARPAPQPSAQLVAQPDGRVEPERPPALDAVLALLRAGAWAEAADRAEVLARELPLLAAAHLVHGLALVNGGRDDGALAALRRAAYLDPDDGLVHVALAGVHDRRGDRDAARRSYRLAAAALSRRAPDDVAGVLDGLGDGADLASLVALCRRLGATDPATSPTPAHAPTPATSREAP